MAFDLDDEELNATREMKGLLKKENMTTTELIDYIKNKLNISENFKKYVLDELEETPKGIRFDTKMILNLFERAIFSYCIVRVSHLNVNVHEKNLEKFFKNLEDEILLK